MNKRAFFLSSNQTVGIKVGQIGISFTRLTVWGKVNDLFY